MNIEGLTLQAGGQLLLDGAAFQVSDRERIALVGPNGCGKSTLMNVLAGRDAPTHGSVKRADRCVVATFDQHTDVPAGTPLADVLAAEAALPAELADELAALEARVADPALYESPDMDSVLARYGDVQREAAAARAQGGGSAVDGPDFAALGFAPEDLTRDVASFSGGERTRAFLARTLAAAQSGGLLLLDEPTNHLDVETIEWLEDRLAAFDGAVVVVAHDRAFLDNVATRVVSFERNKLATYPGDYSAFERRRSEDATRAAERIKREEKEVARQEAIIQQFRHQKRFDGQMASRLKRLAKHHASVDRLPDPLIEKVRFGVTFDAAAKSSNDVARARGVGKRFGERVVLYGLDLDVVKGDRMALVGANGAGKSTLLRILAGLDKADVGNVERPPGVQLTYVAQGHEDLLAERSLGDEVLAARPGLEDEDVRALLGRFGFRGAHDRKRRVDTLSGGERSRLALLKAVIGRANFLVLDEPTNHLDLESRAVLARALNAFTGTLLVVSHDRFFLDSVVTKVAVLARRHVKVFQGDFTEARTLASMSEFGVEKPTRYAVKKGFKDYANGVKHTAGTVLELTPADFAENRVFKTALAQGWMVEE